MRTKPLQDMLGHLGVVPKVECDETVRAKLQAIADDPNSTPDQLRAVLHYCAYSSDVRCSEFVAFAISATLSLWEFNNSVATEVGKPS
jgi:hypothetical protein